MTTINPFAPPEAPLGGADERLDATHRRVITAACLLAIVVYIHRVGFAAASIAFRGPLGLDDRDLGDLMAAFMLGYGLFEMPWGMIADRFGVRKSLAWVVLGSSVLTASVALVGLIPLRYGLVMPVLLVLRFLFGGFQAGTFPSISRLVTDWTATTQRGRAQGTIWMSSRLGGALAPLLMYGLVRGLGDWKLPLVLSAVIGAVWCGWFWSWYRRQAPAPRVTAGPGREWAEWKRLLTSPSALALCLTYGCLGFSGNFFLTLLPTYLSNHRGLGSATVGLLTSLPFVLGMASCLGGGVLSDLIIKRTGRTSGRRVVGIAGMALACGAAVAVPWASGVVPLAVLLAVVFAGNDLAMAPAWAAAADIDPRKAGALSGAMNMAANLSAAIETRTIGRLLDAHDGTTPFLLLGASYLIGALAWIAVVPPRSAET